MAAQQIYEHPQVLPTLKPLNLSNTCCRSRNNPAIGLLMVQHAYHERFRAFKQNPYPGIAPVVASSAFAA
jgi:hypothetical protein